MFGGWLELAVRGARFDLVREPQFVYRIHGANMSGRRPRSFELERRALVDRYRGRVRARDGAIPGPSLRLRLRRAIGPVARRVVPPRYLRMRAP